MEAKTKEETTKKRKNYRKKETRNPGKTKIEQRTPHRTDRLDPGTSILEMRSFSTASSTPSLQRTPMAVPEFSTALVAYSTYTNGTNIEIFHLNVSHKYFIYIFHIHGSYKYYICISYMYTEYICMCYFDFPGIITAMVTKSCACPVLFPLEWPLAWV